MPSSSAANNMGGAGPHFSYSGVDEDQARRLFETLFGGGFGAGGFGGGGGAAGPSFFSFSSNAPGSSNGGMPNARTFRPGGPMGGGSSMFGSMFGAPGAFDSDEEMYQAGSSSADPFAAFGMGSGSRHDPFAQQQQQQHQYRRRQQQHPMRGPRQQEVPLNVKLEDLYTGTTKRLNITRHVADAASGQKLPVQEQVVVNITPGWKEGTRLTYQGLGDEEVGQPAADLVIIIKQLPHSRFERKGNDLHTTVKVPLVTALSGGNLTVQQLDGRQLQVPIQQLIQPRTERVLPGEGMPISKQPGKKGDLHVIMEVDFPRNLTQQQKEALRQILPTA